MVKPMVPPTLEQRVAALEEETLRMSMHVSTMAGQLTRLTDYMERLTMMVAKLQSTMIDWWRMWRKEKQ